MKPKCVYTLNELNKLCPNFRIEFLKSENEVIKKATHRMFWKLGVNLEDGYEIEEVEEGVVSLNKFGEEDSSARLILIERLDDEWISTKYASNYAKKFTKDYQLLVDLARIGNRRCIS